MVAHTQLIPKSVYLQGRAERCFGHIPTYECLRMHYKYIPTIHTCVHTSPWPRIRFTTPSIATKNNQHVCNINSIRFQDFTPKQLSDYILAPTINPKTGAKSGLRGTRKTAFAEGLVDRLTRDATPQNLKRVGKEPREIAEISKKMQVDPSTIMASKDLVKALKDIFLFIILMISPFFPEC